jgi:hypothetical protein
VVASSSERLLRHHALFVHAELPAMRATEATLVPELVKHWRSFAPLHRWLVRTV